MKKISTIIATVITVGALSPLANANELLINTPKQGFIPTAFVIQVGPGYGYHHYHHYYRHYDHYYYGPVYTPGVVIDGGWHHGWHHGWRR